MSDILEIITFGGLSIRRNSKPVEGLASRKVEALLVYLACTGRAYPREVLAELLWEERSQDRALGNLRVALASLRKHLGDYVYITREVASLNPEANIWVDAAELDAKLVAGKIEDALPIYQGDFLEGFYLRGASGFEAWALSERHRWRQTVVNALHKLIDALSEAGRYEAGLAYAMDLLQLDPLDEAAHRQKMVLLAYNDQRSAALEQYETCRQALGDELGVEPAGETTQLYEQIRAGELPIPHLAVSLAPEISIISQPPAFLSEKIEDKSEPPLFVARERELERLDGYLQKALRGEGSVVFVTGGPGRGKTALLGEFARQAMGEHPDLLVAMGVCNAYSGVGDPYLPFSEIMGLLSGDVEARWAAGAVSGEHARRLWSAIPYLAQALLDRGPHLFETFVPGAALLSRLKSAAPNDGELLDALRQRIARQERGAEGLEQSHIFEQITNVLRALADKQPLLLILDDLQWADASSISLLFHLGRRLEGRRILIAGAYRPEEVAMGRDGERHPLEKALAEFKRQFGDVRVDLTQEEEAEGRHFVDALLDSEPNHLDQDFREALYQRTGGQPLFTIELLRAMQARGDLLQDERGRWIAGPTLGWESLPARVEAVIEERIARLEAELRQILSVASVEGEDFTAQVVAGVQEIPERKLLRLLSTELEKRHRLVRETGGLSLDQQMLSRYRFAHALFQRYLYNELSEGERLLLHGEIARVLEEIYTGCTEQIAEQLAHHFAGNAERERYYARLAGERAAARFANAEALRYFSRALDLTPEENLAERYDLLLRREEILDLSGERKAQGRDLAILRDLAATLDDDRKRIQVALRQSWYHEITNNITAAMMSAKEAVQLAEATQDIGGQAAGYLHWGRALQLQGDYKTASVRLEQALGLARASGLGQVEAHVLRLLGMVTDDMDYAECLEQALQISRQIGDQRGEAATFNNLGWLARTCGDFMSAKSYFEQGLEISREIGDRQGEVNRIINLAELFISTGNYNRAKDYSDQGLQVARETDNRFLEGSFLNYYGNIFAIQGNFSLAKEYYEQAFQIVYGIERGYQASLSLSDLSLLYHQQGENQAALVHSQKALGLAEEGDAIGYQAYAWTCLGIAYEALGELANATRAFRQASSFRRELNQPHLVAENLAGLARISLLQGDLPQAQTQVEEILSYMESKRTTISPPLEEGQDPSSPFDGTAEPLRIYLTCYRVLKAAQDPRHEGILLSAYNLLRERATRIEDDELRHSYLKNVPAHREILREWAGRDDA